MRAAGQLGVGVAPIEWEVAAVQTVAHRGGTRPVDVAPVTAGLASIAGMAELAPAAGFRARRWRSPPGAASSPRTWSSYVGSPSRLVSTSALASPPSRGHGQQLFRSDSSR